MNTPNKISLSRLCLIPLIVFFYLATFIPYARLVSALLFIVACLTDFVDGHLARKNNQVTNLGIFLDSIADKVLVMTAMILIVAVPVKIMPAIVYPSWLGVTCVIIMLAREFIISALRQIAATKGIVLAADKGGKIKATLQFVVLSMYMIYAFVLTDIVNFEEGNRVVGIINFVMMILLIITTLVTLYTGASYLIRNKKVFSSKDNETFKKLTEAEDEDAFYEDKASQTGEVQTEAPAETEAQTVAKEGDNLKEDKNEG